MIRALTILALAAAVFGCSREGEVPQAVAVAMTAPQEVADKEVLIATVPTGAKILLKGAEVGATPMKLLIRDDTNVVIEKEGYVRQALMLTPKSDPNVVVTLVPAEGAVAVAVAEPAAETESQRPTSSKTTKKTEKTGDKPKEETTGEGAATETAPTPDPPPAATPPASKTEYASMRQIKEALHAGKITKAEYSHWQGIIRQKRQAEYDATRKALEEKKITKAEYEAKIRAIKLKYEG